MLTPGKRGIGMLHRQLIQRMTAYEGTGVTLLDAIHATYGLSFANENALLDQLAAARILEKGPRWRFQHDLFEEYFAASRIVTLIEDGRPLVLSAWSGTSAGDVAKVLEFIKQLAGPVLLASLIRNELPSGWREKLCEQGCQHDTAQLGHNTPS
jgi:hypothetical protein